MSSALRDKLKDKHLLLCFDAFGTLFKPKTLIAATYAECARQHGIKINGKGLAASFKTAFKDQSKEFPNYGKTAGMDPSTWWESVIRSTFKPLTSKSIPDTMIKDLLHRFSSKEGYRLFGDVIPFTESIRAANFRPPKEESMAKWPWRSTTVGVITNSDNRVPGVLTSLGLKVRGYEEGGSDNERVEDIKFITMSYDVGSEKPSTRIFKAAEEAFSALPSSSGVFEEDLVKVLVGDDIEKDIFGAMNAGWNAILLDRESKFCENWNRLPKDHKIKTVIERGREITVAENLGSLKRWDPVLEETARRYS